MRCFNDLQAFQISKTYLDVRITSNDLNEIIKLVTVLISVVGRHSSPFCPQNYLQLIVPENSPSGTFVGILSARDNHTRYTLRGHPDAILIDSNTGIIRTVGSLDFEKVYSFN